MRITTRQGIQFHGILKGDLKPAIAAINQRMLTTHVGLRRRGAQRHGDAPRRSRREHARIEADARMLSEHLLPKSRAYYQIFLDEAAEPGGR